MSAALRCRKKETSDCKPVALKLFNVKATWKLFLVPCWSNVAGSTSRAVYARVCCRLLAGITGSNPTGDMDVFLLWVLCVVNQRSLRQADPSPRGVLPTTMYSCKWFRNLTNKAALARVGLLRQRVVVNQCYIICEALSSDKDMLKS